MVMLIIIYLLKGNDLFKDLCNFCKQKLYLIWNWLCNNVENFYIFLCKRRYILDDVFKQVYIDYDYLQERIDVGEYGERCVQMIEFYVFIYIVICGFCVI